MNNKIFYIVLIPLILISGFIIFTMNNTEEENKNLEEVAFAMGCFWGAEETFRKVKGVEYTAVGYMGGKTVNPTYEKVCGGDTEHAETVYLKFEPSVISYKDLLEIFWGNHDPTTPDRQGPDTGSQYRSVIFYYTPEQKKAAEESKKQLEEGDSFENPIVTEIIPAPTFYPAEEYHQQYLQKKNKIF